MKAGAPPRFLFLLINKRCNLRCVHCDYWKSHDDDKQNYLSRTRRTEILEEFSRLNPSGRVVICGGEPMLDLDDFFHVSQTSRALGLRCLAVVNGTRIRSAELARRMIEEGPHEISISLNSHREALHDQTRGVSGAYRKAVEALRLLCDARRCAGVSDTKINVMGLIYSGNYREIEPFYDFVLNDIGADKLKLNFLQPTFGQTDPDDHFFFDGSEIDADELFAVLQRCDKRFRLGLSPVWMRQVHMYFTSLARDATRVRGWGAKGKTADHICNTYERNVMVDHYGVARLCFSTAFPGVQLRKAGDLAEFWRGSNSIRNKMRKCNAYCGMSHSVRKEASTIAGNQFRLQHDEQYGSMLKRGPSNLFLWKLTQLF
jgi:MoaA/NifB/PqqE/SkfB family radical SAM enzyme